MEHPLPKAGRGLRLRTGRKLLFLNCEWDDGINSSAQPGRRDLLSSLGNWFPSLATSSRNIMLRIRLEQNKWQF